MYFNTGFLIKHFQLEMSLKDTRKVTLSNAKDFAQLPRIFIKM